MRCFKPTDISMKSSNQPQFWNLHTFPPNHYLQRIVKLRLCEKIITIHLHFRLRAIISDLFLICMF